MTKLVGIQGSVKFILPIINGIKKFGDEYFYADNINDPAVKSADAFIQTNVLKHNFRNYKSLASRKSKHVHVEFFKY